MRQLLGIAIAFGLLAGATALAVQRFGDRELFVSPPDAVAEDFVRAVVTGRYDRAGPYLADASSMPAEELRALRASLGHPTTIESKIVVRDDARALVNVRVSEARRFQDVAFSHARALVNVRVSEARRFQDVAFSLVFEKEWKIVR